MSLRIDHSIIGAPTGHSTSGRQGNIPPPAKSPETAWFVVTTTEEYIFVARALELKAKSHAYVPKDGHGYDRLEVVDPKTNQAQSVWFNTDVDMGMYKPLKGR
jgi:hypothetical protein